MGRVERHGNRTWLVLMCGLMVLPAPAGAKRPKATADIPVQADFRQNLEAKGWTLTPQVAEIYKVGNLYSSTELSLEAEGCVPSANAVEGEFMSTETEGNAGFAISADVRGGVVSVSGQVSGKKFKLSSIKDTRIAQIPGIKFNLTDECSTFIEEEHAKGRDVSGWFILAETVSAYVTDRTCVGHEEALALRAALLVGNTAAVNTGSCSQTNSGNGVVAYKAKTVGEELPGLKPAVAANTSPAPMPAPAPAPPPASTKPPPAAAPAPAPPVDHGVATPVGTYGEWLARMAAELGRNVLDDGFLLESAMSDLGAPTFKKSAKLCIKNGGGAVCTSVASVYTTSRKGVFLSDEAVEDPKKSTVLAAVWFSRACNPFDPLDAEVLARTEAPSGYRADRDRGPKNACYRLGLILKAGKHFPAAPDVAAAAFDKACMAEWHGWACAHAADAYKDGQGVAKDYSVAFSRYERGCLVNHAGSCGMMGFAYQGFLGTEKSPTSAYEFAKKACDLGEFHCDRLGQIYSSGILGGKEPEKAKAHFQRACKAKNEKACEKAK